MGLQRAPAADTDRGGTLQNQTISSQNGVFSATQTYTHDGVNRLQTAQETTAAQSNWQQTYVYDLLGNTTFQYDSGRLPLQRK